MGSTYLIYWVEERGISTCPDEIRNFIDRLIDKDITSRVCHGNWDNLKRPFEEQIKNLTGGYFFFPVIFSCSDEIYNLLNQKFIITKIFLESSFINFTIDSVNRLNLHYFLEKLSQNKNNKKSDGININIKQ